MNVERGVIQAFAVAFFLWHYMHECSGKGMLYSRWDPTGKERTREQNGKNPGKYLFLILPCKVRGKVVCNIKL